jgi:MFS family permease
MNLGFYIIMAAQFFSSLADNALLVAAIALLMQSDSPTWLNPYLKFFFVISYVVLAPYVGAFADRLPKGQVMFVSNAIKIVGCALMLFGMNPLAAYALVGLGAAAYSPAKYGILTEYLPPTKLVIANGWIEGLTVGSIILGTVLGGVLVNARVSGALLGLDVPLLDTGIDSPAEAAMVIIVFVYAAAAAFNLYVPRTDVALKPLPADPRETLRDFYHCCRRLWTDKLGQISLAVTTLFWGAGATLRFIVIVWATSVLHLSGGRAAQLTAVVAVGIAIGSILAARYVSLKRTVRVLPVGIGMGFVVAAMVLVNNLYVAIGLLILIGAMGGYFVVPMNALLQHRGHLLMGAGHSIAVQNFNENISILAMLGIYALMIKADFSISTIIICFGLFISATMFAITRRHWHDQDEGKT